MKHPTLVCHVALFVSCEDRQVLPGIAAAVLSLVDAVVGVPSLAAVYCCPLIGYRVGRRGELMLILFFFRVLPVPSGGNT